VPATDLAVAQLRHRDERVLNDLARVEDPTFDVLGHHQVAFRDDIRTGKVGVLLERLDPYLQPSDHVMEIEVAPGFAGPPLHVHAQIDHVLYVLDGSVAVRIGDQSSVLEAGGCVFIPHGTPHTFGSAGDRPARLLELDTPRTLDAYFRDLTKRFPPGAAIDPAEIGEIQRQYDTTPIGD